MCYVGPILARITFRLLDAAHQNGNKKSFFIYNTVFDRGFRNNRNNLHSPFYKHIGRRCFYFLEYTLCYGDFVNV